MSHKEDSDGLSKKYKERNYDLSAGEIEVYSKVRLPATKAALQRVLKEFVQRTGLSFSSLSFLDLGAGPATLLHAFDDLEDPPAKISLIEKDERLIKEGIKAFPEAKSFYLKENFMKAKGFVSSDVVVSSYSLNEVIKDPDFPELVKKIFNTTSFWLVLEPGTPAGYQNALKARQAWISLGGFVLAPCPHQNPCPLAQGDWCHFSVRVQRDKEHRLLKGGSLSYEDEKFSYMVLSKNFFPPCKARILRHPMERKGLVELTLCKEEGIKKEIFTKSNSENFKFIKKKEWGDELV